MRASLLAVIVILSFSAFSCNSEEIKKLQDENKSKEATIVYLEARVEYLSQFAPNLQIKEMSDTELITLFENEQDFYCKQLRFKDFKIRKIDHHIYDISYYSRYTQSGFVKDWAPGVHRITLLPNDRYEIDLKSGKVCI